MACEISTGLTINCDVLKRAGGLFKRFWLGNISGLATPISALTDGYVTNIPLTTYQTLYKVEGTKFSHSYEINEIRSDEGLVQFEHKLMPKIFNTTPAADQFLEDLTTSEVFAVVQTNNLEFLILGAQNGLTATEMQLASGQKSGDSSATTLTLTGQEQSIYKRLLRTDVNTTLAYLNAMSV